MMGGRTPVTRLSFWLIVVLASACSRAAAPTVAPSTVPAPQAAPSRAIAIQGLEDGAVVGDSLPLTGIVVDAGGAGTPFTTAAWTSSDPVVATITADGVVSPLSPGRTTLHVTFAGASASAELTVHPNVEGTWQFRFAPSFCSQTGPTIGMGCREDGPVEQTVVVTLTQMRGRVWLEGARFDRAIFTGIQTASGAFNANGDLVLASSTCLVTDHAEVGYAVRSWQMRWSPAFVALAGTMEWEQTGPFLGPQCSLEPGYRIRVTADILDFRKID